MADAVYIKMIGDWDKEIGVGLQNALAVSMHVIGNSGDEACKKAIGMMGQAARRLAKQAPKNRKVLKDDSGRYVENWRGGDSRPQKLYQWMFGGEDAYVPGTWENAKRIGNRGLAKRSWLWGLAAFGVRSQSAPIPGTSKVYTIRQEKLNGYIKENRLSYILKAMPHGWEQMVQASAGNRIMGMARDKLLRQWKVRVEKGGDRGAAFRATDIFRTVAA